MNPVKRFLRNAAQTSTAHRGNCPCIPRDQNGTDDAPLSLQPLKGLAGNLGRLRTPKEGREMSYGNEVTPVGLSLDE